LIAIVLGTGAGQARTCTGYDGTTKIATVHPSWATNPDGASYFAVINTGSTVVVDWADGGRLDLILDAIKADTAAVLIDTDTMEADLKTHIDTAETNLTTEIDANETKIDALNNLSIANVTTGCTTSLNNYDPPTRAEATADKDAIIVEVNANETKIDSIQTDTTAILADTNELQTNLVRLLGLQLDNCGWRFTYDGNNNQTGGTIYLYDNAANAATDDGSNGVIGEYSITIVVNANGDPTEMKVVKVS
jgi:hypothetical protein